MKFIFEIFEAIWDWTYDFFTETFLGEVITMLFIFCTITGGGLYFAFFHEGETLSDYSTISTPYSLRISHYEDLNQKGQCSNYREFIQDYVLYRQSERLKKTSINTISKKHLRSLSYKSQSLLENPNYGYLFQNAKAELDTVEVRHRDAGGDFYTKSFIASNITDKDRFFLDAYTSGNTYGGEHQPKLFANIEYNRCENLESEFGLIDNLVYSIEKKISSVF